MMLEIKDTAFDLRINKRGYSLIKTWVIKKCESYKFNVLLSQKRSEAVRKYLIPKGIAEERLTSTGYGEGSPVADNATSAGRAKNRRVELKTSY